jgi:hypothetical protein
MSLDDLVSVSITNTSVNPTRPGFGTALFMAYHAHHTERRVLSYASVKEMTDDGWTVTEPAYLAASKYFGQNPSPKKFKVGLRPAASVYVQQVSLTFSNAVQGKKYSLTIGNTTVTYTVLAAETTTTVATAIDLLVGAVSGVATHGHSTNTLYFTAAAGVLLNFKCTDPDISALHELSTDQSAALTADIAAAYAEDSDFYGLLLDSQSKQEVLAAAAWAETNKKLFVFNTIDTPCLNSGSTTDVMYAVKAAAYARTAGLFHRSELLSYAAAAWMGQRFTATPGSDTWAYKTLAGITVDALTDGQITAVKNKKGSVYTTVAGLNVTQGGTTGSGEYVDVTRFVDWQKSDIQIRVFAALVGNPKIPFTAKGIELIKTIILASLKQGVVNGGLADSSPAPQVIAPAVEDVSSLDRAARNLSGITFTGRLAGAIHELDIAGTVSA